MLSIFATPAEAKAWAANINAGRAKEDRIGTPRRPLRPMTQKRLAGGLLKWVLDAAKPFILNIENYGWNSSANGRSVHDPLSTVTSYPKGGKHAVVDVELAGYLGTLNHGGAGHRTADARDPLNTVTGARDARAAVGVHLTTYHGKKGNEVRGSSPDQPIATLDTQNRYGIVAAEVAPFTAGVGGRAGQSPATSVEKPVPTVTAKGDRVVAAAYLSHMYTSNSCGGEGNPAKPAKTITSGGQHGAVTVVYLAAFYGEGSGKTGHSADEPIPTVVSHDRFAGVSVESTPHWVFTAKSLKRAKQVANWARRLLGTKVQKHLMWVTDESGKKFALLMLALGNALHVVIDIAMRMLRPRELARAQGFSDSYIIDRTADGQRVCKADQVKLIGNSVCPQVARAIVRANVVDQGVLDEELEGSVHRRNGRIKTTRDRVRSTRGRNSNTSLSASSGGTGRRNW